MRRAAIAFACVGLLTPFTDAQAQGAPLCRVHFQDQSSSGLATTGAIDLTQSGRQADGSVIYMGQGDADIVFTPPPQCSALIGHNARAPLMVVATDTRGVVTVEFLVTGQTAFPVTVQCDATTSQRDVNLSTPPSITLRRAKGASARYDNAGQRGRVWLEFCTPDQTHD